jgi:nitrogen fixation NifU-like protein
MDRQAALERLLERYEQPAHRGGLPVPPARSARDTNPRCGDVVTMFAVVEGEQLERVTFDGAGCTVSQVAADLVAELAEGQPVGQVEALQLEDVLAALGPDLVRTRLDCAGLALRTLQRALAAP